MRSDALFTEINFVLARFMDPFLQLFRHTAARLLPAAAAPGAPPAAIEERRLLVQTLTLLVDVYYDFTCQDLPPQLEDAHEEFFRPALGWFVRFLTWEGLGEEQEEGETGVVSVLKTRLLEIAEVSLGSLLSHRAS